jgi:hypothetical protein
MSAIRLYFDEDSQEHAVVIGLRARGINLLTTSEAGRLGTSDKGQLAFAIAEGRCLYTFNARDFVPLHHEFCGDCGGHAGIILVPEQRYSIGEKIRKLADLADRVMAEAMRNRIIFL